MELIPSIEGKSAAANAALFNPQDARSAPAIRVVQLFHSGFGFSRHYPVGSYPIAYANGFTTAIEVPQHREGISAVKVSTTTGEFLTWPGVAAVSVIMNHKTIQLGVREEWGQQVPFEISLPDLRQHIYVIGKTGSGKTTLLRNMINARAVVRPVLGKQNRLRFPRKSGVHAGDVDVALP